LLSLDPDLLRETSGKAALSLVRNADLAKAAEPEIREASMHYGDIRIRDSINVFDQCAQRIAVSSNDRPAAGTEGRRKNLAPIR
jgi:hypothetical protein